MHSRGGRQWHSTAGNESCAAERGGRAIIPEVIKRNSSNPSHRIHHVHRERPSACPVPNVRSASMYPINLYPCFRGTCISNPSSATKRANEDSTWLHIDNDSKSQLTSVRPTAYHPVSCSLTTLWRQTCAPPTVASSPLDNPGTGRSGRNKAICRWSLRLSGVLSGPRARMGQINKAARYTLLCPISRISSSATDRAKALAKAKDSTLFSNLNRSNNRNNNSNSYNNQHPSAPSHSNNLTSPNSHHHRPHTATNQARSNSSSKSERTIPMRSAIPFHSDRNSWPIRQVGRARRKSGSASYHWLVTKSEGV